MERFELQRAATGWVLRGTILLQCDAGAAEARYEVRCAGDWHTTAADVRVRTASAERSLHLTATEGRWSRDGREFEDVRGCVDVDLSWSPSTNTLPIRRLALAVGARRELSAAWVRFPELSVEPLSQEYARLEERRYRYASAGGAFTALLDVDDEGLVRTYAGGWERVAESPAG